MNRLEVLQSLINRRKFKTYLEIGVLGGHIFFPVRCSRKIAVDPAFKFNWRGRAGETWKNPYNLRAKFFEMTSDRFFEEHAAEVFKSSPLDVALIDGMHEYDFVNRDVENALRYLSPNGVIVLHDCNPATDDAACTFMEWKERGFTGYWNGDVWKSILYFRTQRPDLDVFVADCDHGLGIITRGNGTGKPNSAPADPQAIRQLTYNDLAGSRSSLLNLKPVSFLKEFLDD